MMRNFLDIKVLGAIFLLSILKILHFLILLTHKHLHNWRLYYVSISGRHKRDISWAARGVHRWLRTWIEETTWHMWVHKWTVKWRYMWSFYFVDCIHNMSSRSSCQETLCSKKQWMKQEEEESAHRDVRILKIPTWERPVPVMTVVERRRQEAVPLLWSPISHIR